MKKWTLKLLAALSVMGLAAVGFPTPARANEPTAKPGLWETLLKNRHIDSSVNQSSRSYGKNKGPEAGTPASNSPAPDSPGLVDKVCATKPALKVVGMPASVRRDCDYKTKWQGSKVTIYTFCNGVVTSGEIAYVNGESYSGWIHPSAPWGMGRIEVSGRWLGADCGDLKP